MGSYKYIDDLTSDVMFQATGKDLKEVFEASAEAMFEVICQIRKVGTKESRKVEVTGEDAKDLLFNWLQELIALVDTEEMFFSRFEIKEISETKLKAVVYGEPATPAKGETVVKAITYYGFGLEKVKGRWKATVAMDI